MAETIKTSDLSARIAHSSTVLIRQYGRVLAAWSCEDDPDVDNVVLVSGKVVFGGPPAPDMGDDIASWYISAPDVEVINDEELREMEQAKEEAEAARSVFGLGDQGELVVAADGSTVLAAEDMPALTELYVSPDDLRAVRHLVEDDQAVRQLSMRRRTLARFARDYAKAWEDGEDPDLLEMLENNLQVACRRVMELTEP